MHYVFRCAMLIAPTMVLVSVDGIVSLKIQTGRGSVEVGITLIRPSTYYIHPDHIAAWWHDAAIMQLLPHAIRNRYDRLVGNALYGVSGVADLSLLVKLTNGKEITVSDAMLLEISVDGYELRLTLRAPAVLYPDVQGQTIDLDSSNIDGIYAP